MWQLELVDRNADRRFEPFGDEPAMAPIAAPDCRESGLRDRLRCGEGRHLVAQQYWLGRSHQCGELVIHAPRIEAVEDCAVEPAIFVDAHTLEPRSGCQLGIDAVAGG